MLHVIDKVNCNFLKALTLNLSISIKHKTFFSLALEHEALLFGDFRLKSGIKSSYFFNVSSFLSGGAIYELASLYTDIIIENNLQFDSIFGPAYKGIPLAAAVSSILYQRTNRRVPLTFDRKEVKDHGEGGTIVGASLSGEILIIDDVLTAGTALSNSIKLVKEGGGIITGAIVGLDREERVDGVLVREIIEKKSNFLIYSIAGVSDLVSYLASEKKYSKEAIILSESIKV